MGLRSNLRSLAALATGFVLLAAIVLGALWLVERQQTSFERVRHTVVVQRELNAVSAALRAAQSSARGFIISNDARFAEQYDRHVVDILARIATLARLTADNPVQVTNSAALERETRAAMILQRRMIAVLRRNDRAAAGDLVASGRGEAVVTRLEARITRMLEEEERLLGVREARLARETLGAQVALVVGAALVLLLAAFASLDLLRRIRFAREDAELLAVKNRELSEQMRRSEEVEGQLRQLQKMEAVGQLTGGIAHDFNNMLTIVIGSLDMARRRLRTDPDRAERGIDNATEGARRAAQLTARLLAFSRQAALAPAPIDINKLVAGMSELLRRTLGEQLRVETVLAGGLWPANVDPAQLESALLNLCVNARDAMPEGGKLTIETANGHLDEAYAAAHAEVDAGQYVVICVTDTGEGMAPEVIERAFDPFFTTKGVGKGTGLGLSQVYGFMKQSGGHVKIYSEPGHGTTVKLYLPRWFGKADAPALAVAEQATPYARQGEVVLVVEDETQVRHLSVDTLRELGYQVMSASGGPAALDLLGQGAHIDLLFTDIVMPGMTGRQLADAAQELRPGLRVLYTTGYTRNAVVHNGMLDPGVNLLPKPFTVDQLARKIRQVLDA